MLLALASTVRPTSLAAVSALLAGDSRRRLMCAYVTGGLAFTIVFGVIVVSVFHGIHLHAGADQTKGIADIVGGVVLLALGLGVLTGVIRRRPQDPASDSGNAWTASFGNQIGV